MEKKKSTGLLLSILGVISLVLITAGVTYAFFSYTKEGTKTNTITTGAITFRYDEGQDALTLSDKLPMSDSDGITAAATASNNFAFSVTSTTPSSAEIPYVVTVRDVTESGKSLPTDQVKIYLTSTDSNGTNHTEASGVVKTFAELTTSNSTATAAYNSWYNTAKAARGVTNDVVVYEGKVPANQSASAYTNDFTLSMWLKLTNDGTGMTDYSAYEFVKTNTAGVANSHIDDVNGTLISSLSRTSGSEEILTSTEYYAKLNDSQNPLTASEWSRIKYRNYNTGKIITTNAASSVTLQTLGTGWEEANEQYYPLSTKEFSVRVNVYAEGTVYTGN